MSPNPRLSALHQGNAYIARHEKWSKKVLQTSDGEVGDGPRRHRRIAARKEGSAMPKEGDTITSHCDKCQKDTTWVYYDFMFGKDIWVCQECKKKFYR
jgi:hypothetical protein